jgi:uncharacterized protein (TIGR03067 family)
MICFATFVVIFLATAGGDSPKVGDLEGYWTVTSLSHDGVEMKIPGGVWLIFTGDVVRAVTFGADDSVKFRIEPKAMPPAIDFLDAEGKKTVKKGIYKVENNTLTICVPEADDADRPKDFTRTKDKQITVLERSKVAIKP